MPGKHMGRGLRADRRVDGLPTQSLKLLELSLVVLSDQLLVNPSNRLCRPPSLCHCNPLRCLSMWISCNSHY
ncbi:hypothetical protein D0Z67_10575 [Streptomyces seoulensis]|uniref:Uncharacterized protein n=1 Tax=Streptomyces seoulensis TaxID=73044 RepID=A0A4P6U1X7_STRSO|nr:hypothetical protein D0Z67_10575 [Streptomyces seoulensis]